MRTHPLPMLALAFAIAVAAAGCGRSGTAPPTAAAAGSGDAAFTDLAHQIIDDHLKRNPSLATDLGVHQYDAEMEDASRGGNRTPSRRRCERLPRDRLAAIDPEDADARCASSIASSCCTRSTPACSALDVIRQWAKDPDAYSSGDHERGLRHHEARLRAGRPIGCVALIAREKKMPAALVEARKNLEQPAADLHRDRDRADRRQHRLLHERRRRPRSRT